jgi:hypothetical protein
LKVDLSKGGWKGICFRLAAALSSALFLAAGPGLSVPSRAAEAAKVHAAARFFGERFGVASSHIKLYDASAVEGELNVAMEAGAAWLRCDFAWSDLEWVQGSWYFDGCDRVVEEAGARGIDVLGILGTSPPWANGGNPWNYPPTEKEAWRNYVRTVVSRYKGRVKAWEVWNEENIHQFWMPEPDAADYVELLRLASEEIRAADPQALVIMGGVAGLDPDYLNECLYLGAAEYVDALAYHPYPETVGVVGEPEEDRFKPKEELCRGLVDFVRGLIGQYTEKELQVWITEVGWTTCAQSPPGVDEGTQAAYLLRTFVNYAATDVDKVIWYSLRDDMTNALDYYGLVAGDFAPKLSIGFYSTFSDLFGSAVYLEEDAVVFECDDPSTLEAHCFRRDDGSLALAAWKSDDADDVLAFTVSDPRFRKAYRVDPATGEREEMSGVVFDEEGRLAVEGVTVGKVPLLVELSGDEGPGPEPGPEPPPPPGEGLDFYFAEGYTGEGFQEFLCLMNAGDRERVVGVDFVCPGEEKAAEVQVPAGSRVTVNVNGVAGEGKEVSLVVHGYTGIAAERPMYFNYRGKWRGGHVVEGIPSPSRRWYFAEGYTGEGFEEWICVFNPGEEEAELTFRFHTQEEGGKVVKGGSVPPRSRATFSVNELLGPGYQVSCLLEADVPVVAERPTYFNYRGRSGQGWEGGHCVAGVPEPATQYYFAEGCTREGFEEWITLQNPHDRPIEVEALFLPGPGQGDPLVRKYKVEAESRFTVFVRDEVGEGKDVAVRLSSTDVFLAERPMYFHYVKDGLSVRGGHCLAGIPRSAADWWFAEGYTGDGFHQWFTLYNVGAETSRVRLDYYSREMGRLPPRELEVPPLCRVTVMVNEDVGPDLQLSTHVEVLEGPPLVVERPMYFRYGGGWDGGHVGAGSASLPRDGG